MVFPILLLLGIIILIIWSFIYKQEMFIYLEQELERLELNIDHKYINVSGVLAIDEKAQQICLIKATGYKKCDTFVFSYQELISSEILENGKTSSIGINDGGLILARSKKKITSIILKLTINNTDNPVLTLNFYPSQSSLKAFKAVEHWHGLMNVIMNKQRYNISSDKESLINNNSNTDFDMLEKLADLKEKGIITDNEFQAKKKQILGI